VTYDLHPYCTLYRSQAQEEAIREQQLKRAELLVFSPVPRPPPMFVGVWKSLGMRLACISKY